VLRRRKIHVWLIGTAATFSLLFAVVVVVVWIKSFERIDGFTRTEWRLSATEDEWWSTSLQVSDGVVSLKYERDRQPAFVGSFVSPDIPFPPDRTQPTGVKWQRAPIPPFFMPIARVHWFDRFGIVHYRTLDGWFIAVRLWIPLAVLLLGAMLFSFLTVRGSRPIRRMRRGLCPNCGYDIRATPDQCPECGSSLTAWK
jgi:hypothetical protein